MLIRRILGRLLFLVGLVVLLWGLLVLISPITALDLIEYLPSAIRERLTMETYGVLYFRDAFWSYVIGGGVLMFLGEALRKRRFG